MRQPAFALAAVLLAVLLTACASPSTSKRTTDTAQITQEALRQREVALEIRQQREQRLLDVALPVLSASARYCKEDQRTNTFGFRFGTLESFPVEWQGAAVRVYGADNSPRVLVVMRDSPAWNTGLQVGDEILQVNGIDIVDNETLRSAVAASSAVKNRRSNIIVRREGVLRQYHMQPITVCNYGVQLISDPVAGIDPQSINAFADGESIYFTSGMMRFAETDEELALVVAHEVAHNVMNHIGAKQANSSLGTLLDVLIAGGTGVFTGAFGQLGAHAYSQDFEAEADYVGLYLMASAGFDIDRAEYFWRRMAAENPGSIGAYGSSHPSPPERFLNIANTVREIEDKRSRGVALEPDFDS